MVCGFNNNNYNIDYNNMEMILMDTDKIPTKSKIKSKRLFVSPHSVILKGRKIKIVEIGQLPNNIIIEANVNNETKKGVTDIRTHHVLTTHEAGRMTIIWENEEDLKRNKRVPLILHGDDIR